MPTHIDYVTEQLAKPLDRKHVADFVRFMRHVDIAPQPGGCWIWQGNRPDGRYGHFSCDGNIHKAHRWIYERVVGPIGHSLVLRHHCDNEGCVNPEHLEPGTHAQNTQDAFERGRMKGRPGEAHPMSSLTEDDVRLIRKLRECGHTERAVAAKFSISRGQVGKITRRENWSHVS